MLIVAIPGLFAACLLLVKAFDGGFEDLADVGDERLAGHVGDLGLPLQRREFGDPRGGRGRGLGRGRGGRRDVLQEGDAADVRRTADTGAISRRASSTAGSIPCREAMREWAQNSNCALQKRPAIRIAISLSAGGMLLWKRTYSPTSWIRSAASGQRRRALNGPLAPLRGPETIFW